LAFEEIIGNEKNKELLQKGIESSNLLHSYLFVGEDGIGKKLFAREFAKMILCMQEQNKPCNNCKSCNQFIGESHPDFMQIEPEDGKSIKIEQIRFLQEKIAEKPVTSNKKVYIIVDSQTMTREAANALLKTLEEPPEYAVLILLTSNESKLLTTIRSRCTKIHFKILSQPQILSYLKENNLDTNFTLNMLQSSNRKY
jgi:DNA polymerase-3 subunit delta'